MNQRFIISDRPVSNKEKMGLVVLAIPQTYLRYVLLIARTDKIRSLEVRGAGPQGPIAVHGSSVLKKGGFWEIPGSIVCDDSSGISPEEQAQLAFKAQIGVDFQRPALEDAILFRFHEKDGVVSNLLPCFGGWDWTQDPNKDVVPYKGATHTGCFFGRGEFENLIKSGCHRLLPLEAQFIQRVLDGDGKTGFYENFI